MGLGEAYRLRVGETRSSKARRRTQNGSEGEGGSGRESRHKHRHRQHRHRHSERARRAAVVLKRCEGGVQASGPESCEMKDGRESAHRRSTPGGRSAGCDWTGRPPFSHLCPILPFLHNYPGAHWRHAVLLRSHGQHVIHGGWSPRRRVLCTGGDNMAWHGCGMGPAMVWYGCACQMPNLSTLQHMH